jgi:L-lysine exporter family protein LysE/ArgO
VSTSVLLTLVSGFGFGLSLIVAIGAQNAFVLRQGLRREHVLPIVLVCAVSDVVLILGGIAGAGAVFALAPVVLTAVRFAGAAFLLVYGLIAARRALRPAALTVDGATPRTSLAAAVATCLALTWLNPHVYIDTVVLLGSIANTHGDLRWWFGAGAAVGSIVWFFALGFGARLQPVFARPAAWRVLDAVIAVVMLLLAVSLVLGAVADSGR